MALTPLDLEKFELRTGFRGYVREDVERLRYETLRSVEDYLARINALQTRVGELERDLQQYRANEDLLKSSVVLVQKTSDELITAARQRAELIVREAEAEGEVIRRRLADIRNDREQFEYAFHGLLSGFLHRLEQGNPALTPAPAAAPKALPTPDTANDYENTPLTPNRLAGMPEANAPVGMEQPTQPLKSSYVSAGFTVEQPQAAYQPQAVHQPQAPTTAPRMPSPSQPAGMAAAGNERDHDIDGFSAALDSAPVQPSPPRISAIEHGRLYSIQETEPALAPAAAMPAAFSMPEAVPEPAQGEPHGAGPQVAELPAAETPAAEPQVTEPLAAETAPPAAAVERPRFSWPEPPAAEDKP
jgi:cell division initiation protein